VIQCHRPYGSFVVFTGLYFESWLLARHLSNARLIGYRRRIGFDIYGYTLLSSFNYSVESFERNLLPRLHGGQAFAATTTGHAGRDRGAPYAHWTLEQFDAFCVLNAAQWARYSATQPQLAGVFPWHWHTYGRPGRSLNESLDGAYNVGLINLTRCRAAYQAIGAAVVARAQVLRGGRRCGASPSLSKRLV
jgi:hypothetical protein